MNSDESMNTNCRCGGKFWFKDEGQTQRKLTASLPPPLPKVMKCSAALHRAKLHHQSPAIERRLITLTAGQVCQAKARKRSRT